MHPNPHPAGAAPRLAARGVDCRRLEIKVEGGYDHRGCLALEESARSGFDSPRYTVDVDTHAPPDVVEEIRRAAQATSPMFDNILRPTPIEGRVSPA